MSQVSIIDIEGNHPQIPTRFDANVGFAIPIANVLEIFGDVTAAGTNPVHTVGSGNNITTYVQISQAIAATDVTKIGLANFNSDHFSVDANGFVSLLGSGQAIDSFTTDVLGPVAPDGAGNVAFTGATNIFSSGSVANTMRLNLQGTNHALFVGRGTNTASANLAVGTNGQVLIAATGNDPAFATLTSSDGSITFTPGANSLSLQVTGGTTVGKTITGDSGGALSPTAGNWDILGQQAGTITVVDTVGSGSTLKVENRAWLTPFVVDPSSTTGLRGTYQTIASALTDAVSGQTIFIRDGTYTENLTLKAGVNLVAFNGEQSTPNVTVIGKLTMTTAGTASISNIRLQTNSDFFLAVTGSAASIINLNNCYLNCSNNTGISFTSSSGSAIINLNNCLGDLSTTGIALFSSSSSGTINILYTYLNNSGVSSTDNTISAGILNIFASRITSRITTSGTSQIIARSLRLTTTLLTGTALVVGGSGTSQIFDATISSGTNSSISIGSNLAIYDSTIDSSAANVLIGAGTLIFSNLTFTSSAGITTTTQSYISTTSKTTKFTSSTTWTKDPRTKSAQIIGWGGGGGGGTGRRGAEGTDRAGGGGGSCQGVFNYFVSDAFLGTTATVTIGAGGAGGAAPAADNTDGNNGTSGGITSFGNLSTYSGAVNSFGSAGTTTGGAGGSAPIYIINGMSIQTTAAGGAGNVSVAVTGTDTPSSTGIGSGIIPTGGGGGGGRTSGNANTQGGRGGNINTWASAPSTILAGGAASGFNGNDASTVTTGDLILGGTGGGGRLGNNSSGDPFGGIPGGGGGGSSGRNNGAAGNPGGAGARGEILIIEYF